MLSWHVTATCIPTVDPHVRGSHISLISTFLPIHSLFTFLSHQCDLPLAERQRGSGGRSPGVASFRRAASEILYALHQVTPRWRRGLRGHLQAQRLRPQ
jgi:hypothetical protein